MSSPDAYWRDLNHALGAMGKPGASRETAEACQSRLSPHEAARLLPGAARCDLQSAAHYRARYARSGTAWHRGLAVEYACASGMLGQAACEWADAVAA